MTFGRPPLSTSPSSFPSFSQEEEVEQGELTVTRRSRVNPELHDPIFHPRPKSFPQTSTVSPSSRFRPSSTSPLVYPTTAPLLVSVELQSFSSDDSELGGTHESDWTTKCAVKDKNDGLVFPVLSSYIPTPLSSSSLNTRRRWHICFLPLLSLSTRRSLCPAHPRPRRPGPWRLPWSFHSPHPGDSSEVSRALPPSWCCQPRRWRDTLCCAFWTKERIVMLASALAILITFYAWTVECYWGMKESFGMDSGPNGQRWAGWDNTDSHAPPAVTRMMIHSHNDEMQGTENALNHALSLGFGSIEVDLWLAESQDDIKHDEAERDATPEFRADTWKPIPAYADPDTRARVLSVAPGVEAVSLNSTITQPTLLVGHKEGTLIGTLQDLYFDPLIRLLDENNEGRNVSGGDWVGLYKDDPKAEVQILLDTKSDGESIWPYLVSALEPFVSKGYVTSYHTSNSTWSHGPLLFLTGHVPVAEIYYSDPRTVFFDAPLLNLTQPVHIPETDAGPATTVEWTAELAPMASSKLPLYFHAALAMPPWGAIERRLKDLTYEARKRGIKSRWWGHARWTSGIRRRMWEIVRAGGADWVGGDDLDDLAKWERERAV